MSITALIPVYDAAATIRRALDSALAQTRACDEILVIDDASRDETCAIVEEYAARHPTIRLVRQAVNGGPGRARNRGLDEATGDWIAILDADDAWRPGRNAALLAAAEAHDADLLFDNVVQYDAVADVEVRPGFVADFGTRTIDEAEFWENCRFGRFQYSTFKFFVRTDFLRRHGLRYIPDLRFGEDIILYGEIIRAGARTVVLSDEYYIYTQRVGAISKVANSGSHSMPDFLTMAEEVRRLGDRHRGAMPAAARAAMDRTIRSFVAADRFNAARAAKRDRRYLKMAAELLRPDVLKLIALVEYRKRVTAREHYPR